MIRIPCCEVEDGSGCGAHGSCDLVSKGFRLAMYDFDVVQLLFGVDGVEEEVAAIWMFGSGGGAVFCLDRLACGMGS